jgi:hypothetical protein
LNRIRDRKRRPPNSYTSSEAGAFALRPTDKQGELERAFEDRLEALAQRSKKSALHVASAKAEIWRALNIEQTRLAPSVNAQIRTKRSIRNWRLGKSTDWIEDQKSGKWSDQEVNYGPRIDPAFAASLVRLAFLRRERGKSEEQAVVEAAGVKEVDLSAIEHRAFELVIGKRGFTRTNAKDRAVPLAKAVLKDWLPSEPACRLIPPTEAPALTIETIVHIAVPFLDELAGRRIGHSAPYRGRDNPAEISPPALGALVAIARMAHPRASLEHVRHSIRSYRRLNVTPMGRTRST